MALTDLARKLTDYGSQQSLGSRLRARRIEPFLRLLEAVEREHGHIDVIDIGGTEQYWGIIPKGYLEAHRVKVTIVNLFGTTPPDHGPFVFVRADACDLSAFADNSFHLAHSNSVIEHVGDWTRMVQFANELRRLARRHFVQTPNFWFPIEPHFMTPFFHWLPKPTRVWLLMHMALGHYSRADSVDGAVRAIEGARLLSRKMFSALFADSELETERFLLLPKSLIAIRR